MNICVSVFSKVLTFVKFYIMPFNGYTIDNWHS